MSYLQAINTKPITTSTNKPAQDLINEWFEVAKKIDNISDITSYDDIPVFNFRPLSEIRQSLEGAGHSATTIESIINGLSELPEYSSPDRTESTSRR